MQLFSTLALAQATTAATPPQWIQYAPLLFIGIIFYFLLIRPQQKQRKEHQTLLTALKTGDKIITSSGIHGIISNVKERTFTIKVADNVKVEFDKTAIVCMDRGGSEESSAQEKDPNK
jgi:preprotein translocase subunit YajC